VREPNARASWKAGFAVACALAVPAAGCESRQSITSPVTDPAREINTLWWAMFAVGMVVFGVVIALLVLAYMRRGRASDPDRAERMSYMVILGGGMLAPVVVLAVLFAFVIRVMPAVSAPEPGSTSLTIQVIGHQWYWEVRYPGTEAVTANEIHLPAGTPVRIVARTADVIHSFWVPRLNRKIDMIPGRSNAIELDVPRTGTYRGQCSEFCGLGHAEMAFEVIVQPPDAFRTWLDHEAEPAETPAEGDAAAGAQAFETASCGDCHTIRGTSADGRVGPDLTHVGSRNTLAALTIANTPSNLMQWITNPQGWKPGSRMPGFASLPASTRQALVAYLEGLR
jgi:cytochrome c oxidase subunit II